MENRELTKEEKQYIKMTTGSPKKLVIKLGLPTITSMLITAIYNISDTFFVSQLGKSASGAVGVVFGLTAIIQAIGFTFGMGSSSLISSLLGQKKSREAQKTASSGFYCAIMLGALIAIITLVFMKPILLLLGATDTVLPYAESYVTYIAIGFPIMIASFVLNNILRGEGKAKLAMIGLTTGGILNMFLDPLFINVFGLGISGAAIATLISQCVGVTILLSMFIFKRTITTLSIRYLSKSVKTYLEIVKVGLPSLSRQGLASLASILLNRSAGAYGDSALSAMTIVSKVFMVIFSVGLGIGQGYQPVCGYNFFAKKYDRVKEALGFTFISSSILMTIFCIIVFFLAESVMRFFIDDSEVIAIGARALRLQCIALPFLSLNVMCNMTFQSIRYKWRSTFLSSLRQGLFFIPLVFILPSIFGLEGVEMIQATSDFLTFLVSIPFFIWIFKMLKEKQQKEKIDTFEKFEESIV